MKKLSIVIWTGAAWERWAPPILNREGIGGSETAVIHMARELCELGHEVTCIGDHRGFAGIYDGVNYVVYQDLLEGTVPPVTCDIMISSRDKQAHLVPVTAKKKILWVHDLHVGDDWRRDLVKYDRVFCLSEYAKRIFLSYYAHLDLKKIWVTRNGIDIGRYLTFRPKGPTSRFTYSSSPDRGLDVLLTFWPQIRAFLPEAELHVYYGFDTWRKMVESQGNRAAMLKVAYFESAVKGAEKQGVHYHGRVGQYELSRSQCASSLWLYPTAFLETYCITALEAQAAGSIPITTAIGALTETVKHGVLLPPRNTEVSYRASFLEAVKSFTTDDSFEMTKKLNLMRDEGRNWALTQSWKALAYDWSKYFEDLLQEGAP